MKQREKSERRRCRLEAKVDTLRSARPCHAGLKARTLAASQPSRQARKAAKSAGFVEVSAAHLLAVVPALSLVMEYVAREGGRLTLTVPASCQGFDLPALVAALRGP